MQRFNKFMEDDNVYFTSNARLSICPAHFFIFNVAKNEDAAAITWKFVFMD